MLHLKFLGLIHFFQDKRTRYGIRITDTSTSKFWPLYRGHDQYINSLQIDFLVCYTNQ